MPLFASKTDVSIDVDRDEVTAGETVRVSAGIGELDKKVQGARLELGYRNTFQEDDTDADGDRTTRTRTADVVVATEHIATTSGTSPGRVEATFTIPPDAPGSAADAIEWFVRAVVDRKRARDANAVRGVTVLTPADALAPWAQAQLETDAACPMQIAPSSRTVRPGDTITGTLSLTPNATISARAVRVQLRRERHDPDRNTDTDARTRVELCGPVELTPGTSRALDFAITVPADAPPSFRAHHNHQHWYLEGVVDVKRASDPTVRAEIVVHTG